MAIVYMKIETEANWLKVLKKRELNFIYDDAINKFQTIFIIFIKIKLNGRKVIIKNKHDLMLSAKKYNCNNQIRNGLVCKNHFMFF